MSKTALIFGAGKTGRGFAAHLAFLSGYEIVLVDKNKTLVDNIKSEGKYDIQVLGDEKMNCTVAPSAVYQIDDTSWHNAFVEANVVFTAVFGNHLEELAVYLAEALHKKCIENPSQPLTIITCENKTSAAKFLKDAVLKNLNETEKAWLSNCVGFSEAIVFRTCLDPAGNQSPLTIRAQAFFELPCDGDAIKGDLHIYGLKPLRNFSNQLKRKIFTYNCINAVIAYLGAKKGYKQLADAATDEEILSIAEKAADESSKSLTAEFGFDAMEQKEWTKAAFKKFGDANVPDPIERNGADPQRKLSRDDRLIGPALLALKHGIQPEGLMEGIIACINYHDPVTNTSVATVLRDKGPDFVLREICGLRQEEELFGLIKTQMVKRLYEN